MQPVAKEWSFFTMALMPSREYLVGMSSALCAVLMGDRSTFLFKNDFFIQDVYEVIWNEVGRLVDWQIRHRIYNNKR